MASCRDRWRGTGSGSWQQEVWDKEASSGACAAPRLWRPWAALPWMAVSSASQKAIFKVRSLASVDRRG